ncbi:EGF domain-specific O-linked N-acetylglucosamine transferase [Geodia barretti]|uniref:EGF domain-specific O-linked N-acetylglucosamine transferase n=1 Tax=Geodia barretti TaxID=519541 RepID=A0AA35SFY1_GEOBA|nr:EGF domain-specific O-linked N-acetylglucosamine transferase [Geodia barretti]
MCSPLWTLLLLATCLCPQTLRALKESYRRGHDGSTVDEMLARLGEGPALFTDAGATSTCEDSTCEEREGGLCWGYERDCTEDNRLFVPRCDGSPKPWAQTMEGKMELFWTQADFGYVKKVVDSLAILCSPKGKIAEGASQLICSAQLRYCRARNLYMDLRRYRQMTEKQGTYRSFLEDIFEEGEIGGNCELDINRLRDNARHKSPLQSWYAELGGYSSVDFKVKEGEQCDEIVTRPTVFIKLDAVVNMYHHFCDFFNIYASQHVNGSFSDDVQIVIWDTTLSKEFRDPFIETWRAFTRHPVMKLAQFQGKRVRISH